MSDQTLPGVFFLHLRMLLSPSWWLLQCHSSAFWSNSCASLWVTHSPYNLQLELFVVTTFTHPFTHSRSSCDLSDCAVSSTHGRFCFHHSKNSKLHALSSPSAIKLTLSCTFGGIRVSLSEWPALTLLFRVACSNSLIHSGQDKQVFVSYFRGQKDNLGWNCLWWIWILGFATWYRHGQVWYLIWKLNE